MKILEGDTRRPHLTIHLVKIQAWTHTSEGENQSSQSIAQKSHILGHSRDVPHGGATESGENKFIEILIRLAYMEQKLEGLFEQDRTVENPHW